MQKINVELEEDISIINGDVAQDIEPKIQLNVDSAPIQKGEVVGTATYSINGEDYVSNILASETLVQEIENNSENSMNSINAIITILIIAIITVLIKFFKKKKTKKDIKLLPAYIVKSSYKKGKHSL